MRKLSEMIFWYSKIEKGILKKIFENFKKFAENFEIFKLACGPGGCRETQLLSEREYGTFFDLLQCKKSIPGTTTLKFFKLSPYLSSIADRSYSNQVMQ
ncbi:MAG: hypothetical protein NDP13_03595 [Crenarchaeota archaeon]|nr:hypothetical protein [Thermoproteota archaeon]MCR8454960.1 hypothetical protein [Thermoproteota archaeon]